MKHLLLISKDGKNRSYIGDPRLLKLWYDWYRNPVKIMNRKNLRGAKYVWIH